MSEIVSKVGVHCVGPRRNGYGPFLNTINAAGRRLSVVKCRDDFGAMDEPLQLWPEVLTIGAYTEWDDANYNVETAYNRIAEAARLHPEVNFWEYLNERNGDWVEQADFYISLIQRLASADIGLCVFNCASGTPQLPMIDPEPYKQVARVCSVIKNGGFRAILGLHEYLPNLGRYARLADYLEFTNALVPIAITEYLTETYAGKQEFMLEIERNDPLYIADRRVLCCATWTLGGGGWQGSNFESALPELGEYIATVQAVTPPPEDREFDHWEESGVFLSTDNPLSFVITSDRDIKAVTRPKQIPPTTYTCLTSTDGYGGVTGGGTFSPNATVTLEWHA